MIVEALPLPKRGHIKPRVAPPIPARSMVKEWREAAADLGISPMKWQDIAARYLCARDRNRWLWPEVAIVAARQNGKTEILMPRILMGLKMGRRMLHTAQVREIPRNTFLRITQSIPLGMAADILDIRYANGQEVIKMRNGGRYTLVAPRPGVRGHAVDDVFLDETREQHSFDLVAALRPTITASRDPQIVYLSNAGDDVSVVLNDLRRRAETDRRLCYLEWSASPDRAVGDREGWAEANPALGVTIQLDTLEAAYSSLPLAVFETEHLCRWVISSQPRLVAEASWDRAYRDHLEPARRPMMALSVDPNGRRASVAMSWQQSDGTVALELVADIVAEALNTDALGRDLRDRAVRAGVMTVGYGAWTDADLARHFKNAKAIDGRDFANASLNFAALVDSGRLRWTGSDAISDDLGWTARRPHDSGAWVATPANDERAITASLAAIRATWLASAPKPAAPRVF